VNASLLLGGSDRYSTRQPFAIRFSNPGGGGSSIKIIGDYFRLSVSQQPRDNRLFGRMVVMPPFVQLRRLTARVRVIDILDTIPSSASDADNTRVVRSESERSDAIGR